MKQNTYKKPQNTYKKNRDNRREKNRKWRVKLNNVLDRTLNLDPIITQGLSTSYIPYILYLAALGVFYVGNTHYAEKVVREINQLENKVENLRADYATLKVDYMFFSKQSEIAKRAQEINLVESNGKVQKLSIKKGEYE